MRLTLQYLRDIAETHSQAALAANDRDSADAWENIGLAIDTCQTQIRDEWNIIKARLPLGTDAELAAEIAATAHNRLTRPSGMTPQW